jgi:membrane-associated protein
MTYLDQHLLLSAFAVLLLEEAGVPLPLPGDIVMVIVGVAVRQEHVALWQGLASMEVATVLGASVLYGLSARGGRVLAYRYGRFVRLNPARLARVEGWVKRGGWRAIVLGRLVPGSRIATVVGSGLFAIPFREFLPALALGGLGYIVLYTLLGYVLGPAVLALLEHAHAIAALALAISR